MRRAQRHRFPRPGELASFEARTFWQ